jgi:hypothetical protein
MPQFQPGPTIPVHHRIRRSVNAEQRIGAIMDTRWTIPPSPAA